MEPIFGVHEQALLFRARRSEVLSANLANADTPGFKARDIEYRRADFASSMQAAAGGRVLRTDPRHLPAAGTASTEDLKYRNPHQPSLDGNTVETDLELARFAENAVAYQASLMFLNGRISSLRAAISGRT